MFLVSILTNLHQVASHVVPSICHPVNGPSRYRPLFIIGSGRSGNTLLRRIVQAHPDFHIPPETYVLGTVISSYRRNLLMSWNERVHLALGRFAQHPEFGTFDMSLHDLADRLCRLPEADRNLAAILDAFYREHAEQHGIQCLRWGDKTPLNTYQLDAIHAVFPDAQFIHMVRDGCDVVSSYVKAGIYDSVDKAAERWVSSIEMAEAFGAAHPANYAEVRYEDLVTDPEAEVTRLCAFLDIEFLPGMLASEQLAESMGDVAALDHHEQVFSAITPSSVGKGRNSLNEAQMRELAPIMNASLRRLDYAACTS